MKKSKKNIQPTQYYYPGMVVPYYMPVRKTKKNRIQDFSYTYAHNVTTEKMFQPPRKKIIFNQNDNIYKFTKNLLNLYNIDYKVEY